MILLGSTGSIGVNTLNIARQFNLTIDVLTAGYNISLLNQQIREFKPSVVVIASSQDKHKVNHTKVYCGETSLVKVIEESTSKLVINGLVGFLGLAPTLSAIQSGKKVALANKESLVVAGSFIDPDDIIPIDSEHFGLWYLQQDKPIHSMSITASGGSFRDYPLEQLHRVSIQEALNHPNWLMGNKITIDSATMTNKLFELLEAKWLFFNDQEANVDAIIEPQSLVHALIHFQDGSTTAHIAKPDMKLPIAYALKKEINSPIIEPIDLTQIGSLHFKQIDPKRYPIWEIKNTLLKKPHLGLVLNAANEIAVDDFLNHKINFLDISKKTLRAIDYFEDIQINSIEEIVEIDQMVRKYCAN